MAEACGASALNTEDAATHKSIEKNKHNFFIFNLLN
jgi:hypothetical protein